LISLGKTAEMTRVAYLSLALLCSAFFRTAVVHADEKQPSVSNLSSLNVELVPEEVDDEDLYYEEDLISWDELPTDRMSYYVSLGWTREKWDFPDEYYMRKWKNLNEEHRKAAIFLGWTEEDWDEGDDPDVCYKSWEKLTPEEVSSAVVLGFTKDSWRTKAAMESFSPVVLSFSIPELESMNLNYLQTLDAKVAVVDGTATLDDENVVRYELTMSEYVRLLRAGSKLYLKYEDHDPIKAHISSSIGSKITSLMRDALSKSPLRDMGYYLSQYDTWPLFEENYSFFVGGTNTSTPMHYDYDEFNFLWVVEGRKRVVMLPNDERTVDEYDCISTFKGHSCWSGVDILEGPLPEFAVEVELGPGDGLLIPGKAWHAVKNLEPSVAYGLRIDPTQYKL
jgi:hypothetical protein